MDVAGADVPAHLRGDRLSLGDLLGLQPIALQHVLEVHVAADVELVGPIDSDAAVLEQLRKHSVGDGGAYLGLDVVANDRDTSVFELLGPLGSSRDEDRKRVHERYPGVDGALRVEPRGIFGTDGQVADQNVSFAVLEYLHHIDRVVAGLGNGL